MDTRAYYEAVARMQKLEVDREFIQGWIGGYLKNPRREEQRVTQAYEAGYEAGENGDTTGLDKWVAT